jgi:hypothetical protein
VSFENGEKLDVFYIGERQREREPETENKKWVGTRCGKEAKGV